MVIDGRHQQWQKGKTKIYKVRKKNVKEREKHVAKLMIHKKWKKVKFSNWKCWFQKQIFNKEQMFCSYKAVALFLHFHYNFLTNTPQLYINCDCTMTPTHESLSTCKRMQSKAEAVVYHDFTHDVWHSHRLC